MEEVLILHDVQETWNQSMKTNVQFFKNQIDRDLPGDGNTEHQQIQRTSVSHGKSYITLQHLVIEALPQKGHITAYNGLQFTSCYQYPKNQRQIYSGTMHYNTLESSAEESHHYNWLPGFP